MVLGEIRSEEDILKIVEEVGFLPFFANEVDGFSIEECCPPSLWFAEGVAGPWEWKGPVARTGKCIYGKFFNKKAGFVSREWFPHFANYRRDGYDFDTREDLGMTAKKDEDVYNTIQKSGVILSKTLKEICGYRKGGNSGFETVITRLQMGCYVNISDFTYMQDAHGKTYGWGVALYSTPEILFGYDYVASQYKTEPNESKQKIIKHLKTVFPNVDEGKILKLIK
jgi:hypothetical protein